MGGNYHCRKCDYCYRDGHKYICFDEDIRPDPNNCFVLSFGIGHDMSFDRSIAKYNCSVLSFEMENRFSAAIGKNLHLLGLGISNIDAEVLN